MQLDKRTSLEVAKGMGKFQIKVPSNINLNKRQGRRVSVSRKLVPGVPMMKKVTSENQDVQ